MQVGQLMVYGPEKQLHLQKVLITKREHPDDDPIFKKRLGDELRKKRNAVISELYKFLTFIINGAAR